MITVAHLADLHIYERHRFDAQRRVLSNVAVDLCERAVDLILIAGDLAGPGPSHRMTVSERFCVAKFVRECSAVAPVVVIRGNHDARGELSLLAKCAAKNPIFIAEEPTGLRVATRGGDVDVICLPWMPRRRLLDKPSTGTLELERSSGALALLAETFCTQRSDDGAPCILLAHYGVSGGIMSESVIGYSGDVVLPAALLDNPAYSYIALGHLHIPQAPRRHAVYPGSLVPISYGEHPPRGYVLAGLKGANLAAVNRVVVDSWRLETVSAEKGESGKWVTTAPCITGSLVFARVRAVVPAGIAVDSGDIVCMKQLFQELGYTWDKLERVSDATLETGDDTKEVRAPMSDTESISIRLQLAGLSEQRITRIMGRFELIAGSAADSGATGPCGPDSAGA